MPYLCGEEKSQESDASWPQSCEFVWRQGRAAPTEAVSKIYFLHLQTFSVYLTLSAIGPASLSYKLNTTCITGGSHFSHTVVKPDSCLAWNFCHIFSSFSLYNLM